MQLRKFAHAKSLHVRCKTLEDGRHKPEHIGKNFCFWQEHLKITIQAFVNGFLYGYLRSV